MVMDDVVREVVGRWMLPLARGADVVRLRPLHLTSLGLVLGFGSAVAAGLGWWWTALGLWVVSRAADGLDGVLARLQERSSDIGGFLDIMADFAVYGTFVLGIAVALPGARVACAALLVTYYLNGSAFLAISGLAEKRRQDVVDGDRSLQFVAGLAEGTETFLAHTAFVVLGAVAPTRVAPAVWVFTVMVAITVVQRVVFGHRVLSDSDHSER